MSGIVWGVVTGLLLAGGQYFMSLAARSIDFNGTLGTAIASAIRNPNLYLFLLFNLFATVSYLLCLRQKQLIDGFTITTFTVSAAVFVVSLLLIKTQLNAMQTFGFVLAIGGIVLMNRG